MSSHGRRGLARLLLGSQANKVVTLEHGAGPYLPINGCAALGEVLPQASMATDVQDRCRFRSVTRLSVRAQFPVLIYTDYRAQPGELLTRRKCRQATPAADVIAAARTLQAKQPRDPGPGRDQQQALRSTYRPLQWCR